MQILYPLSKVQLGTTQTLQIAEEGRAFNVTGDGKLERFMVDDFTGSSWIASVEDTRVKVLAERTQQMLQELGAMRRRDYMEGDLAKSQRIEAQIVQAFTAQLGSQWSPARSRGGSFYSDFTQADAQLTLSLGEREVKLTCKKAIGEGEAQQTVKSELEWGLDTRGRHYSRGLHRGDEEFVWAPSKSAADQYREELERTTRLPFG